MIAAVLAVSAPVYVLRNAHADDFDAQIAAIQRKIDQYQDEATRLAGEADTLKSRIAILDAQQATLQAQIDKSENQRKQLVQQIKETEIKIAENRDALGETVADIYIGDGVSPLEMFASSDTIGDFIDKQEYRSSIQDNLVSTITEIETLKKELEQQKIDVERVIEDQKNQRAALAAKRAERSQLLAETQGRESEYRSMISEGKSKQSELRAQQQAAIAAALAAAGGGGSAVAGDPSRGGYPSNLANAPYGSMIVDPWGMYNRECVSYTAWKVYQKNGYMPYWGGKGHAYQWPANADAAGIPRGSVPRPGSVGILYGGPYGHTVWVESVNADGTINISQYNEINSSAPGPGMYSERYNVPASAYATYIYF